MYRNKKKLSDVQLLALCHFFGLVLLSFYGIKVFEITKAYPNIVTRLLLPINKSIWEMSKMLVMPLCIIFTVEFFIVGKKFKNFIPSHVMIAFMLPVCLIGISLIYEAVFSTLSMDGAHVVFFLALLLAAFFTSIFAVTSKTNFSKYFGLFLVLYILLCTSYVVFSLIQPLRIGIFYDTVNQTFGALY